MLLTSRYIHGKTTIRHLTLWHKNIREVRRSASLSNTFSTFHVPLTSPSLQTNLTSHHEIHTSAASSSSSAAIWGSPLNNYQTKSVIKIPSRSLSTKTTWNESSLPDKIKSLDEYKVLYDFSIKDPNGFWKMAAERLDWYRFPTKIKNTEFDYRSERGVDIKWYEDGILNACYNCLDRHIEHDHSIAQQVALIFEPDTPTESRHHITYGELLRDVK
ncbi:unnamed protein product, partial [Adineta ricciae]